jgi:uncharacterized protein YdhG (YjbR/CyaY superfamily)
MAKTDFKSVNEYIASKPREVQVLLRQVRGAIRKAIPGVEEKISYQIPSYRLNGMRVFYFAGWKKHFSLYPAGDALVDAFKDELAGCEICKGTIKFPYSEPVPVRLIERIAKFRVQHLLKRERESRARRKGHQAPIDRIRRICATTPGVFEKLSHGMPTFFVEKDKGVFTMFTENHHPDGHLAVWLPAPAGLQAVLIEEAPATYFKPPYVGVNGWIGINLDQIDDEALQNHIRKAWQLVAKGKKKIKLGRDAT